MLTVTVDIKSATKWLSDVQKRQIPYATSVALNKTATLAQQDIKAEMVRVLEKPKPYTLGGTFVSRSTKTNLTAIVGLKDKAASGRAAGKYLAPLVAGVPRNQTGWERALQGMGAIPQGMRAVPAAGADLDGYGNMRARQITEIMGSLKRNIRTFKGKGKRVHASGYFVAMPGHASTAHLAPGIYNRIERAGDSMIKPVVVFVERAQYRPTIKLYQTVMRTVNKRFWPEFNAALMAALATAR